MSSDSIGALFTAITTSPSLSPACSAGLPWDTDRTETPSTSSYPGRSGLEFPELRPRQRGDAGVRALRNRIRRKLSKHGGGRDLAIRTDDLEFDFRARAHHANALAKVTGAADRLAVQLRNHVTGRNARLVRSGAFLDFSDDGPVHNVKVQRLGQFRRKVLDHDSEPPPTDLSELDQLVHDSTGHGRRYRETDPDIAARKGEDGSVDPDQLPIQSNQGSARVSGVDGGVGLG